MNKSSCLIELRPNRLLLDPSFGGYKLSLDPISIFRKQISSGVNKVEPSDDQYSYSHVKLFSLHNHLHINPYSQSSVYFVGKNFKVFKVVLSPFCQEISLSDVYQIPPPNIQKTEIYNISIKFPSPGNVLISDGGGGVYFAKIIEQDTEIWTESVKLFQLDSGCVLSDAKIEFINDEKQVHILFLQVKEKSENDKKDSKEGLFQTVITWKTFLEEGNNLVEKFERKLNVDGSVDYAAFEPGCTSIYVISDKLPKWISDSKNPIKIEEDNMPEVLYKKIYSWTQTKEEITLCLPVSEGTTKENINVVVDNIKMEIKINGETIISSNFFHRVQKELTSWTLEKGQLEIQLIKEEEGLMWKTLLPEDERGEEILDPDLVQNIHEKLAHLCSEKEEGAQPSFNTQQLEECDVVTHEKALVRINGEIHTTTHEISLSSSPWLFNIFCEPSEAPAICCRHDVDACVWQFKTGKDDGKSWPHEHIGTFSAFGYVQASKTQKKYITASPNLSYAAICEASHHIYIYRQPSLLATELKNRHTGKKVDTISKQQLINLEAREQILGVYATNNLLCVLLENLICILVINE